MELQARYAQQNAQLEINKLDAQALIEEGKSLYAHDAAIDGGKFVNALRASIRPTLTLFFFFAWLAVKGIALYHGIYTQNLSVIQLVPIIWDTETSVIFSAIIGFWFGSRAMEKRFSSIRNARDTQVSTNATAAVASAAVRTTTTSTRPNATAHTGNG
jgi:hypothetical protein